MPFIVEEFLCRREKENLSDLYSMAVLGKLFTCHHQGQVPSKISTACILFLNLGEMLALSSRHYSSDLVQGSLELPCRLGEQNLLERLENW